MAYLISNRSKSLDAASYHAKVAELRKFVELEAQALQDVVEAKDSSLREVAELSERKSILTKQITVLEERLKSLGENFAATTEKKRLFIENAKGELASTKKSLKEVKEELQAITEKVEELKGVAGELQEFVAKETDARKRWLQENVKLGVLLKKQEEVMAEIEKSKKDADSEKKNLDDMKTSITEFYGKLGTYVSVAKQTLEHVNKSLKESGVPIEFDVAPGEVLKVDFNNFTQLL